MQPLLRLAGILFALLAIPASAQSILTGPLGNYATQVAWGDSLTVGNQDGSGTTYPNALGLLYAVPITVTNKGVGGDTSSQILTRFLAAPTLWGSPTLIWAGRNNIASGSQVLADVATMVADLTTPNYLILSITNDEGEPSGSTNYNQIAAINASLASTYGSRYLDVRSQLVAAYNPANGADVIDHTNDIPPFTLRAVDLSGTMTAVAAGDTSFTTTPAGNPIYVDAILTVGTEYIYVLAVSGNNVTNCTRGYGGTTATSHSGGAAYTGTDKVHFSGPGYALIAGYVYRKIQSLGGWRQ